MSNYKLISFLPVLLLLHSQHHLVNGCSFPSGLVDSTWVTSNRGTWTVNSTHISDMKIIASVSGASLFTMQCYDDSTGNIILKSEEVFYPFTTIPTYVYACLTFSELSTNKYSYSMLTSLSAVVIGVYERIILRHISVTSVPASDVCTDTTLSADRTHIALRNGTESSSAITCPTNFQGYYTYTGTTCGETYLSTCTDTQFIYNYTYCSDQQMFSSDGLLYCMYSATGSGYTYLTLYNSDSSVDESTTFQFTCMVLSVSGTTISSTINPEECLPTTVQTATTINATNGKTVVFTNSGTECNPTTTEDSSTDMTWLYIVIAVLAVVVIVIIVIVIICCLKKRRRPKVDEEKPITEENESKNKEKEKAKPEEDVLRKENEEDKTSVDSGFIPDKIDKEEQENMDDTRNEEEVNVEEDAVNDEDKDRPETGVSKMSDLGSTLAPSEQVEGETPDQLEEQGDEKQEAEEESEQKEEEGENEDETRGEDENDEESRASSPEDPEDPDEVDRRIRMIGLKKDGKQYAPLGQLSKYLITRKQAAKMKKGLGMFIKMKSKKKGDDRDNVGSPDPENMEDEDIHGKPKAAFMEQYHTKKRIERQLEEEHYWSEEDDDKDNINFAKIDDEFEESFPPEKEIETKQEAGDIEMAVMRTGSALSKTNDQTEKDREKDREKDHEKDREKDSGNDSPGLDKNQQDDEKSVNIDSDPDLDGLDDDLDDVYVKGITELPVGFVRDAEGKIIRKSDGKVISEEAMEKLFQKAKVRKIFKIARLRRNKKGRPTGGFVQDGYGPDTEIYIEEDYSLNREPDLEDGPKPKQPRSSDIVKRRKSTAKVENGGGRMVVFGVSGKTPGNFNMEDDLDDVSKDGRSASTPSRELLKKRLFKSKKRKDRPGTIIHVAGVDEDKPRELNSLVKVYGKPANMMGMDSRPLPPPPSSSLTRNDSKRASTDPEQMRQFRQGLEKDRLILNNKQGPRPVREAFGGPDNLQVDDITMEDEDNRLEQSIRLGDEDEFVVVGQGPNSRTDKNSSDDRLFTILRHPGNGSLRGSHNIGPFCTRHDLRHSIPWSLRAQPLTRQNTAMTDSGSDQRSLNYNGPKSADASKRDVDDARLKQLLEELYQDKKYFDHVIDSTDNEMKVNPVIDERDLAEHGRGYLLDRAAYWDQRMRENPIPLPPWFVPSRMNTTFKLDSGRGSQASTMTPPIIEPDMQPNSVQRRENTIT